MAQVSVQPIEDVDELDDERRRFERADLVVRVDYATVDELFSEFTRDINEGGLQIDSDAPRPVGTTVTMQFHLATDRAGTGTALRTHGTVVWSRPSRDGEPGSMGIEFDELTSTDRALINELVRELRADS